MKKLNILFAILCAAVLTTSCYKEEALDPNREIVGLGGEEFKENDIDRWIWNNVTKPYNIEVKYRWDRSELDYDKTLVPIDEDKVIPAIMALKMVWIEPYEKMVGVDFIRAYSPKKYVFVGSLKYNGQTVTLGEAEGGRKITLYRMNQYDHTNRELVRDIVKTAHHEFTHILNQTIRFAPEFDEVTPGGYEASWTNTSDEKALRLGFISNYASSSPTEDFAEMVARICVFGADFWAQRLKDAQEYWDKYDPTANNAVVMTYNPADALRTKESLMVEYMKNTWNVNIYPTTDEITETTSANDKGLQYLVQEAIDNVVAGNYEINL